jgi:hypothetical protein
MNTSELPRDTIALPLEAELLWKTLLLIESTARPTSADIEIVCKLAELHTMCDQAMSTMALCISINEMVGWLLESVQLVIYSHDASALVLMQLRRRETALREARVLPNHQTTR